MDAPAHRGRGAGPGKTLGIASFVAAHEAEVECDLMERAGMTLDMLGRGLSARALGSFIEASAPGSRIFAAMHPELEGELAWQDARMVPQLLALVVDSVRMASFDVIQSRTAKNLSAYRPRPIPRPGVDSGERRIGSDAIPISEFEEWW